MAKNTQGKTVTKENAYEIWQTPDGSWTWYVLKKYQAPKNEEVNQYARWLCLVVSPYVPNGEMGDVYVDEIKREAKRIK